MEKRRAILIGALEALHQYRNITAQVHVHDNSYCMHYIPQNRTTHKQLTNNIQTTYIYNTTHLENGGVKNILKIKRGHVNRKGKNR